MKKTLIALACTFSLSTFAQSTMELRNVTNANALLSPNEIIYMTVAAEDNAKVVVDVKNISSTTQSYNLKRYDMLLNTSASAYFCFGGGCFTYETFVSPSPLTLTMTQSASELTNPDHSPSYFMLTADLDEGPSAGMSTVKYTFMNAANSADSIQITIKYNTAQPVGIKEVKGLSSFEVFPNPAKETTSIKINALKSFSSNVLVYNALGDLVSKKDVFISEGKNNVELSLQNLPAGLYFVNLKTDNSTISKKLIIN